MTETKSHYTIIYSFKARGSRLSYEDDIKLDAGLCNLMWLPP